MKYEEMIRKRVPQKALLLQTVEEIAETVKAGCKMLRALGNGSPTPVKPEMARENLQEEVHDLVNMWHVLDMERAVKAPLTPQNIGGMKSEEKAILGMMHHLTEASAILMDQAAGFQDGDKVATKAATLIYMGLRLVSVYYDISYGDECQSKMARWVRRLQEART